MAKKTSTLDSILNGTYQSGGIEVNKPATKKKKKKEEDIAPIKKQTNDRTWFSGGAFSDGYQFGDVTKTILGTASDVTENLYTGALGIGEKTIDAGAYLLGGGAKLFGADKFADNVQGFIEKDFIDEEALAKKMNISNPSGLLSRILNGKQTDENSLIGEKTDSLVQSGGQLAGTYGLSALGVPWWATTGVTSFGGEVEQAFKEDATYGEAGFSGLVTAGAEILSEKLSGGISFGGSTVDDLWLKPLTEKITNKALQKLTTLVVQATGEGLEEVFTEVISNIGKKLSYEDEKTWEEMLASEEAMDSYLESFIGGAVLGGIGSATNINSGQENASDTEVEEDIAPIKEQDDLPNSKIRDKDGKLLTVYHGTRADFDTYDTSKAGQNYEGNWSNNGKGIYFTDNKDEALEYAKSSIDEGEPKVKEAQLDITNPFDSSKDYTNELSDMAQEYGIEPYYLERGDRLFNWFNSNKKDIVEALKKYGYDGIVDHGHYTVFDPKQIKSPTKSVQSPVKSGKDVQKSTYFKYEPKETDSIYKKALYESATKSMNDSEVSHKFADVVAKMAEDKKTVYKFTNNQELKKQGYDFKGLTINGLVNDNGEVLINVDSKKALNSVVGHETTHLLEGTKEYEDLKNMAIEYAKTTGEYDSRLKNLKKLYKGKKADIDAELTADIVGDYLFTNEKFVKELSVQKPTVFQKIKELIDDLVVRFKGTAEEKQLRKLQKTFEKAYQQDTSGTDTKFSLSENGEMVDDKGRTLTKEQQEFFKDSKARDENGNLKVVYHGTNQYFNIYKDSSPIFLTDNKNVAKDYARKEFYDNANIKEQYVNITNPFYYNADGHAFNQVYRDLENAIIQAQNDYDYWGEPYDGMIIENIYDAREGNSRNKKYLGTDYVVFNSNQIKNVDNTNPTSNPDIRYSLSDDKGRTLTKGQKEYFKDSKARDENGSLVTVYHTTTNRGVQFNEFNPVGTPYYRFGDQVVNYYTNSKDMSGSYAEQKYNMADTKKLNSLEEAKKWLEDNRFRGYGYNYDYDFKQNEDGSISIKFYSFDDGNLLETLNYQNETQMFRNIKSDTQYHALTSGQVRRQYEGYVNITNPYVVDAEGRSWDKIGQDVYEDKYNEIKNLTEEQKQQLKKLLDESNEKYRQFMLHPFKLHTYWNYETVYESLDRNTREIILYASMTNSKYSDFAESETWKGTVKSPDTKVVVGKYSEVPWEMTLEEFVEKWKPIKKEFEESATPARYFEKEYKKIYDNKKNLFTNDELYNLTNTLDYDKGIRDILRKDESTNDIVHKVIEMNKNGSNYDGVIIKKTIDYGGVTGTNAYTPNDLYITFNSEQFKAWDNENPTSDKDIRYSLSEEASIEDKINSSMTMGEAKKMIQIAFQENRINDWREANEKYANGDEWLNDVGVDEVATYIDNTESTIINYTNPLYDKNIGYGEDYYTESILEAYQNGTLKGSPKEQASRLDTSTSNDYQDDRFYSPREVKATLELYNKANQRVTNSNRVEVYKARADFIIATHQKGVAEQLGLTQQEINKKVKSWANYTEKARNLSNQLNENVSKQNQWAGLENSSIVNTISISNEEMGKLVKEIKGDSSGWQRQYITSTMLALDTHIDYSKLTFEFDQHQALREEHALGDYNRRTKTIRIGSGYQNTVAHEIGHYIDNKWAEDFGFLETSNLTDDLNFDVIKTTDEVKQFNKNFQTFMNDLVKSATVGYGDKTNYYQSRSETFARFVGKFVEWTKNQATNNRYGYEDKYYNDSFTESQYREFVKILQEKALLDTTGQTIADSNIKHSLSDNNEEIAPIGDYNVFGSDVKAQEEIAPVVEQSKDIAPVEETKALTSEDLPALQQQYDEDFKHIQDTDIAPEGENIGNFIDESLINVKKKNDITSYIKNMFGVKINEARKLYDKIANLENPTVDDIYDVLEDYRRVEYQETLEDKNADELRKRIRNTRIDMSNLKHQITDYNAYRKRNFGNLRLSNSGTPVDVLYQELVETGYFSADVTNEADQLLEIENFMNNRNTTESIQYELSDSDLYTIAEELSTDIGNRERYTALNHMRGSLINYLKNHGDAIAPIENASETQQVEEIAPVEEQAPTLREVVETEDPVMKYIERRVEREQKKKEKAQQEATIDEDQYANNNVVPKKKPTLKERATKTMDAFQSHFVNRNRQIDKLSKASGNKEIKFKGDRVNNISGEIGGDIFTAQTDNYGNVIGKPLDAPFESARQEGLDSYFDNYLKHKSNIERHAQEKGSAKVSAKTSQKYVEAYESKYPQFIEWSNDVYTYNRNNLNNAVNNGLISNDLRNLFTQMYGNYVPFYATETQDLDPSVYMTPDEIRTSMPVKRAKGGSDTNLLSVEQAMIQQTYAYKNSIAKNDLYKEIGKVIDEKIELGADVRQNPLALEDTLYADENGKYLTYYDKGKRKTVKITDELYTELNRDLENQIRNLEEKYSLITKPLQKISQIRGQILTTYNAGFVITNPFKDIQDALLNTKNFGKFAKNVLVQSTIRDSSRGKKVNQYATEFKKLTGKDISSIQDANTLKGKAKALFNDYQAGTMWNRFITSYGTNATSMEFGDNGIEVNKKNKGFLNAIEKANNYMEVMFRYPEFKATLEKGGSFTEALYNAREVTTNFGRGGTISKAINRNGATFFNTSVQGMDKFFRNFSGENGARGFIGAVAKASSIGILPAVLNHLLFGDDDEEYEALPDYIKDNYYLFKTGEGEFIRIPKGRMIAVLGSAGRRTLELASGEENAFEGFLTNASDQIGASNPLKENVFSPLIQAYGSENGEAWYGGDLVPTRLQDKPKAEQFDEGTDEFSKWLGEQLNISPYKLNYVIDQYSGGFGDLILPMITNEAKSDGTLLAPLKDKFVVNSTDDNKYVGELYDLSDELTIKSNSSNATDEDKLKNKYMNAIKSDMSELYKEKREIQNSDLSKEEKYKKAQAIQDQINDLAKEALGDYESVEITDNYSSVGSKEYYKTTEGEWYSINEEELTDLNSMGMTSYEKNSYFGAKNNIYTLKDSYEDRLESATDDEKDSLYTEQKREIIDEVRNSGLTDNIKSYLYDRYYGSTDKLNVITETNIPFDTYLELEYQDFKADKNNKGQTISGSKKKKIMNFIESSDLDYNQKIMLHKIYYPADDKYNYDIADYVFNNVETYETRINILETLGFTIDENGVVHWD